MRFVFDIDGTICTNRPNGDFDNAKPYKDIIKHINELYDNGHYIIFFTARGMWRCEGIIAKTYNMWYTITEAQLKKWGVKYHELHLGKPLGDVYVDDKAFRVKEDGSSGKELKKFLGKQIGLRAYDIIKKRV